MGEPLRYVESETAKKWLNSKALSGDLANSTPSLAQKVNRNHALPSRTRGTYFDSDPRAAPAVLPRRDKFDSGYPVTGSTAFQVPEESGAQLADRNPGVDQIAQSMYSNPRLNQMSWTAQPTNPDPHPDQMSWAAALMPSNRSTGQMSWTAQPTNSARSTGQMSWTPTTPDDISTSVPQVPNGGEIGRPEVSRSKSAPTLGTSQEFRVYRPGLVSRGENSYLSCIAVLDACGYGSNHVSRRLLQELNVREPSSGLIELRIVATGQGPVEEGLEFYVDFEVWDRPGASLLLARDWIQKRWDDGTFYTYPGSNKKGT